MTKFLMNYNIKFKIDLKVYYYVNIKHVKMWATYYSTTQITILKIKEKAETKEPSKSVSSSS
jgi:hypothetical protein